MTSKPKSSQCQYHLVTLRDLELNLPSEGPSPQLLGDLLSRSAERFTLLTCLALTPRSVVKWFSEGILDDLGLFPYHAPVVPAHLFDRQVAIVDSLATCDAQHKFR